MLREQYTAALRFLQATAVLVLLVGCANLANLMLGRATTREREIAARIALGASHGQVVRLLLFESLLLSLAGAVAGVFIAEELSAGLVRFLDGGGNPLFLDLSLDSPVALDSRRSIATLTCVLSGLAAAWRAAGIAPQ